MRATLAEVESCWSMADLLDAHAALDLIEDCEARARNEAEVTSGRAP